MEAPCRMLAAVFMEEADRILAKARRQLAAAGEDAKAKATALLDEKSQQRKEVMTNIFCVTKAFCEICAVEVRVSGYLIT